MWDRKRLPQERKRKEDVDMRETILPEQQTRQAIIIADGVSKYFTLGGYRIKAVDNVSFQLAPHQFIAITGPSGCGKSTLLYLLGSLERPTMGTMIIDGVTVNSLHGQKETTFRRTKVGFVFQLFYLIPNLSALENVMLPMELASHQTSRHEEHKEHAQELLYLVGIDEKHQRQRPRKLSGGEQQRVAVARALANDPAVLLADEPTGNLDGDTGKRIVELLRQLVHQGRTIVVVTHDESIAEQADVRIRLADGHVVSQS
jgi:ABC-type lipoprotein export system ATPase subunit